MKAIVHLLALLCLAAFPALSTAAAEEIVRVAVYRGPASCDNCSETAKIAIEKMGPRYQVDFIGPEEAVDIAEESLRRYDVYVQPGGGQDIAGALRSLGDRRVSAIRNYVARGGRYLGLCMGAYLADEANIGLIGGDLDSEVGRPNFSVTTIEDAAVTLLWQGRRESIFYQDGPFLPRSEDSMFREIATYINGDIAAARYGFGKGAVVLSGPHPEADETWFEDAGIALDRMPRGHLLKDLFYHLGR